MRNSYINPETIDGQVMKKQAETRRDKDGETTIVHAHVYGRGCNEKCMVYEPGHLVRSVAQERMEDNG